MANRLFQQARQYIEKAKASSTLGREKEEAILKAKNALSSAYANSTFAEQQQLQDIQKELEQLK